MKKTILAILALVFSSSLANAGINSTFTSDVQNREPANKLEELNKANTQKIIFHTTITDMNGQRVFHIWKNNDKQIHKQIVDVTGSRWRVWSSMVAEHFQIGDVITVEVQDDKGNIVDSKSIKVRGAIEVPTTEEEVVKEEVETITETIAEVKDAE